MADRLLAVAMILGTILTAPMATADPPDQRQAELLHRLRHDCGSCHGMTLRGGLGPPLLPSTLQDKDAAGLAEVILKGMPGTPMPPWDFEIARDEAVWLARRLKEGVADAY